MQSKHPTAAPTPDTVGFSSYFNALRRRLTSSVLYRLGQEPRWGITLFEGDWTRMDTALRGAHPVRNPPGRYFADPFLIEREGRTYCFIEDYVHSRDRAHISVLEIRADGVINLGACLEEPFHLSFPYWFEYQGDLYLCPEASASRSVRIYRCVEFPLRWELATIALQGFAALDTLIFEHGGRWWLLTGRSGGTHDPFGSELHVFFAASPLTERWEPLPGNPVIADPVCGRNGGMIREGARLLRVAQWHEHRHYGRRLTVREITRLDETGYSERVVARLEPDFRPGLLGVHHLSSTGRVSAVDHQSWAPAFEPRR